jgi:hypothetical protein
MNFPGIMLSERSQSQKVDILIISFKKSNGILMKNRSLVTRGQGWEEGVTMRE